jgi:hypothetical protein
VIFISFAVTFIFCAVSRLNRTGRCGLIHLAQDRDQWRAVTNTEMNHLFPQRRTVSLLAEPLLSTPFSCGMTPRHWVVGSWQSRKHSTFSLKCLEASNPWRLRNFVPSKRREPITLWWRGATAQTNGVPSHTATKAWSTGLSHNWLIKTDSNWRSWCCLYRMNRLRLNTRNTWHT